MMDNSVYRNEQKPQDKVMRVIQGYYSYYTYILLFIEIILATYLIIAQSNVFITVSIMGLLPILSLIILFIIATRYPLKLSHFIGVSSDFKKEYNVDEATKIKQATLNNTIQVFLNNIKENSRLFEKEPKSLQRILDNLCNNLEQKINYTIKTQDEYSSNLEEAFVLISLYNKELEETINHLSYYQDKNYKRTNTPPNGFPNHEPNKTPPQGIDTTGL